MFQIPVKLRSALESQALQFETIHHHRKFTAQMTAQDTHTPGKEFAKAVILRVDGKYAMAVLPAHHRIDLKDLRRALNAGDIRLATEEEIYAVCPDCEIGAEPPFGNLYGMPVYLSSWMAGDEFITFKAGAHDYAIRMRFSDYLRLVKPDVLDFSTQH